MGVESKIEYFRDFIHAKGLRYTPEREAIAREVFRRKGHFDPEELHQALRREGHKVSRASVYRTLPLMMEAGILEQVEMTDKHAHYERVMGREHHDHMLCVSCGRVIEFYSEEMEKLQERLCEEEGFQGASHTLEIKGYCSRCRKKAPRPV
ncbi:MAG: transcriptional repressor [Nitrospirota bacterium]|jgi:Fur family ferric uptake transcriptional regulator